MLRPKSGRSHRRAFPIQGYTGSNGGGKSACAVWDSIPSLLAGRPILSTVRILDFERPRLCDDDGCSSPDHGRHMAAHPLWEPLTEWRQLLEAEHCDVIMDEVTGVASSRESASMPAPIANLLVQLRRRDIVLRWTTPNWRRADTIIRECTQAATVCRGFLSVAVPAEDGQPDRMWRQRRLFRWTTYDAADLDDFTTGKREAMKPWVRDIHWGPGSPAFAAYDTFDAVLALGTVSEAGRCMECGGSRRAPACSCADRPARGRGKARAPLAGAPSATEAGGSLDLLALPETVPPGAVASDEPSILAAKLLHSATVLDAESAGLLEDAAVSS